MKQTMIRLALALAFVSPSALTCLGAHAAEGQNSIVAEATEVSNEQMVQWYQEGRLGKDIRVFDSRPTPKYIAGHIPGAIGLPLDELKKNTSALIDKYAIPKTSTLVFYCAGRECSLSIDSADIFRKLGYGNALVYRNGIPGWNQKLQPLLAEEAFIQKGNLIAIDVGVGKSTLVSSGIQTLQLGIKSLGSTEGKSLLADVSRNAPVVVLARDDMDLVNEALEELRDQDFRRLAYFPLSAWKAPLAAAPALAKAQWTPVYGPGQISPKEFENAVVRGEYILDIRPAADYARGHFKNAINIPIDDFENNWSKIPRDKPVYFHCATGARSLKAFDILGRKGYSNISYLDAEVSCKANECTIKE